MMKSFTRNLAASRIRMDVLDFLKKFSSVSALRGVARRRRICCDLHRMEDPDESRLRYGRCLLYFGNSATLFFSGSFETA